MKSYWKEGDSTVFMCEVCTNSKCVLSNGKFKETIMNEEHKNHNFAKLASESDGCSNFTTMISMQAACKGEWA